jgi:ketosteroid isomerase-like protein
METLQLAHEIRKVAMHLDKSIENKDVESILSCFADDCEIELLGIKLKGKKEARKWINWLYTHLADVKFIPVTILVERDMFFEEFIAMAKLHNGIEIQSKQAEVLMYENYKVKSLRLYFDRLDFADSVAKGFISKRLVRLLIKKSLKGLI